ncbi:MAG TPA: AarF/UbiB family protein [Acidimicrobiia bacterium]|jgi:ubiquinone biosynthesis protein
MSAAPIVADAFSAGLDILVAFVVAVVATSLSLRLLAIRRGWVSAMLSGLIGWGVAWSLALSLSGWDWGSEDLLLHTIAIGIPATMAAAVGLDLVARPGSLAVGERAALFVVPRPLRTLRRRIEVLRRYRELLGLARKEGFGPSLSGADRGLPVDAIGIRLRRVLEEAGGVYIKLGQIAATRVDLIPPEICAELAELQNRVTPVAAELIKPVLEAELGTGVDAVFAEFDWEPLAAASIGQTYRARLHSGEHVVVKVQRPGVEDVMERDLAALALLADMAQRRTLLGQGIRSGEVLEQFAKSLRAEVDFLGEVDAMIDMAIMLGESSPVRIPKVYEGLCTRRVLVQERFEGITLADTAELDASTIDRDALAHQLLATTMDQILRIGFFHADPHPGNIFVLADGSLGLIDFGAVGRLDPIQREAVRDMLMAIAQSDVRLLRESLEQVADVHDALSPDQLERALARLLAETIRPTGSLEPTVLQELVRTVSQFGLRLPGELILMSRALVTLDGTLRVVAPGFSLGAAAAEMMTTPTARQYLDPQGMLREWVLSALPHIGHLPARVDRVLSLAGRGDLRVRSVMDEDGGRLLRTLANRGLLSLIGSVFLVAASLLLISDDPGPIVASGVGLFDVFGYGGLLAGSVLLLRVVAAVVRDGTT